MDIVFHPTSSRVPCGSIIDSITEWISHQQTLRNPRCELKGGGNRLRVERRAPSTIYRWVQRFAPEMEKRLRWQWRRPRSWSWRIDETYVRVRGQWAYLYRALDKFGNTIDFYLSATRNTKAAKRFLGKALNGLKDWELPEVLNTDKARRPTPAPSQS